MPRRRDSAHFQPFQHTIRSMDLHLHGIYVVTENFVFIQKHYSILNSISCNKYHATILSPCKKVSFKTELAEICIFFWFPMEHVVVCGEIFAILTNIFTSSICRLLNLRNIFTFYRCHMDVSLWFGGLFAVPPVGLVATLFCFKCITNMLYRFWCSSNIQTIKFLINFHPFF